MSNQSKSASSTSQAQASESKASGDKQTKASAKPKATGMVLVQNRTARPLGPTVSVEDGSDVKIVSLLPGLNRIAREDWDAILAGKKNSRFLTHHLDHELLFAIEDSPNITSVAVTRAVNLVKGTYDKGLLRDWKRMEERKPVRDALDAQLDLLDGSQTWDQQSDSTPASAAIGPS